MQASKREYEWAVRRAGRQANVSTYAAAFALWRAWLGSVILTWRNGRWERLA